METETINAPQKVTPLEDGTTTVNRVKALIEREMNRTVGETVIAKPLWNDFFRVNWYAIDSTGFVSSNRISKSLFIQARLGEDGVLIMEDRTVAPRSPLSQYL